MPQDNELLGILVAAIGVVAAIKLVNYLDERRDSSINRYEAAVAAQAAASVVVQPLEELVEKGWIQADGDPSKPNERSYRLSATAPSPA